MSTNKKGNKKGKKGESAPPSLRDCAYCGASEGSIPGIPMHRACGRCEIVFYCGPKCQQWHWKAGGHKQHCIPKADRRVAGNVDDDGGSGGGGCFLPKGATTQPPLTFLAGWGCPGHRDGASYLGSNRGLVRG